MSSPLTMFRVHSWDRQSRLLTAVDLMLESATGEIVTGTTTVDRLSPHTPSWCEMDDRGWHGLVLITRWWDYTVDDSALTRPVSVHPVDFDRMDPDGDVELMTMIPSLYLSERLVFEMGSPVLVPRLPIANQVMLREPDEAEPYFLLYAAVGDTVPHLLRSPTDIRPEQHAVDGSVLGMPGLDLNAAAKAGPSGDHIDYLIGWAAEHVQEGHTCTQCAAWTMLW